VSEIAREIASQPWCWREAAQRGAALAEVDGVLPRSGAPAAAVGCGTSLYVAQAYASLREELGHGPTDAFPASEAPVGRGYPTVVAISRSGTTTEVVRYLSAVQAFRRVAVVGVLDSPVAGEADEAVALEFADERAVVQTRFATSALAFLRAHVGQDMGSAIEDGERAVEAPLPLDPSRYRHYVFLGRGWSVGLANEAALKLREAARAFSESYPAMEFRHGPISVAGPESVVWALGPIDPAVLEDAAATGATVLGGDRDPMAELIVIQRTAVALAEARGLDPDHPRHLTRSVVLS
jgi:fructoselysine-6-P-deglycase FrlB-like protein